MQLLSVCADVAHGKCLRSGAGRSGAGPPQPAACSLQPAPLQPARMAEDGASETPAAGSEEQANPAAAATAPADSAKAESAPSPTRTKKSKKGDGERCAAHAPLRRRRRSLAATATSSLPRACRSARSGLRQRKSSRKKVRCNKCQRSVKPDPQQLHVCDLCMRKGTYARCTAGCDFDICANCYVKKGGVLDKEVRARVHSGQGRRLCRRGSAVVKKQLKT